MAKSAVNGKLSPVEPERVSALVQAPIRKGAYVLYWMQKAQRAIQNPALEHASALANDLDLPLVVLFILSAFPGASEAHYRFMLGGLDETADDVRGRGGAFVLARLSGAETPATACAGFAREAAVVICDAGRIRIELGWRRDLAGILALLPDPPPLLEVETEAVVPPSIASPKEEWSAATFRRKVEPAIPNYLRLLPLIEIRRSAAGLGLDGLDAQAPMEGEATLSPIAAQPSRKGEQGLYPRPGRREAMEGFDAFLERGLDRYEADRNDPSLQGQSCMSPWLHFGQVSPVELAILALGQGGTGAAAFMEQLVVRRELAANFVLRNGRYDAYEALPSWALRTLEAAKADRRSHLYAPKDFEGGATHDPYWNAAQDELVLTGRIHNYMRMYWGKKILEWSASPEEAFGTALWLNDAYALDGRDPNGYAGVAWCFGKHDRPWANRPVYGSVRCMTAGGLERKFDIAAYVERIKGLVIAQSLVP